MEATSDKIALFDMDGSLADYDGALKRDLRQLQAPCEPSIGDDLWTLEKQDHFKYRMRLIKSQPGWWRNLELIENGRVIFELAKKIGFRRDVLTKGPASHPIAWKEKLEWCQYHLGADVDVHIVRNKGMVYGTMLYDDYPEYMELWLKHRPRGLGIMPVTSGNKSFEHPRVVRWDGTNFDQVYDAMQKAFNRQFREELVLA